MRYPNAKNGMNKIFIAIIITLSAAGLTVINSMITVASPFAWVLDGGYYFLTFTVLAAGIVAAVFNILGLNIATRDNRTFNNAVIWMIINIAAGVGGSILGLIPFVGWFFEMVGTILAVIANFFAISFILKGCTELLPDPYFSQKASTIKTLLLVTVILEAVGAVFSPIPVIGVLGRIAALGAGVVAIIYEVFYIIFVVRAKNSL